MKNFCSILALAAFVSSTAFAANYTCESSIRQGNTTTTSKIDLINLSDTSATVVRETSDGYYRSISRGDRMNVSTAGAQKIISGFLTGRDTGTERFVARLNEDTMLLEVATSLFTIVHSCKGN